MTTLTTMYAPQANSPATSTVGSLGTQTTQFEVLDAAVLPAAPMLLVLGGDTQHAETVLMTAKNGKMLTVTRAVQGTARSWEAGTEIARLFTAKDHEALIANIEALDTGKLSSITAAEVITGEPGTDAAVEIVESGADATVKFTIPRGLPGATGGKGPAGADGAPGPNEVSTATATNITGLLKGNGSTVAQAIAGTDYANATHGHAASNIGAGTLGGQVQANAMAAATVSTAQVRNIYAGTADMTAGTSTLASGAIYFVYE